MLAQPAVALVLLLSAVGALDVKLDHHLDPQLYHTTQQLLGWFKAAASQQNSLVRYDTIPDSSSDANLPVVSISDWSVEGSKEVVLLVAGEHPQELIGAEILYWLGHVLIGDTEELSEWAAYQPVQASAWKAGWTQTTLAEWARSLIKAVEFKILPVASILGRQSAEEGDYCRRKTSSGVDLGHNWPFQWQKTEPSTPSYGGPAPLSEPETRIIKLVAETSHPRAYVGLHAGAWALHWPQGEPHDPKLAQDAADLCERLNTYCQCNGARAVNSSGEAGWDPRGSAMSFMHAELQVPLAMTWQVYGPQRGLHPLLPEQARRRLLNESLGPPHEVLVSGATPQGACLQASNPLGQEEYQEVVAKWLASVLVLADHAASQPHGTAASRQAHQSQLPLPPTPPYKSDMDRLGMVAAEERQSTHAFEKDAKTVAAQQAEREARETVRAAKEQAIKLQEELEAKPRMRRAELLAVTDQHTSADLHSLGRSRLASQPHSSRSLLQVLLAGMGLLVLVAVVGARAASAAGLSPAAWRGAPRRGAARRQGRSL